MAPAHAEHNQTSCCLAMMHRRQLCSEYNGKTTHIMAKIPHYDRDTLLWPYHKYYAVVHVPWQSCMVSLHDPCISPLVHVLWQEDIYDGRGPQVVSMLCVLRPVWGSMLLALLPRRVTAHVRAHSWWLEYHALHDKALVHKPIPKMEIIGVWHLA